jgi:hypothetical protein
MVKTRIKFERASVVKRVEIFKVRKLRRNRDGFLPIGLAIENLNFMAIALEG